MKKNNNPLISVIVPVFNVEKYLQQCIDSLLRQNYSNIEIILVDDGSTDNSAQICDEYATKYKNITVIHKKNEGLGSSRNIGLQVANGKYIGFVDSDDYLSEDMYETLIRLAEENDADCSYCEFERFWDDNIIDKSHKCNDSIKIYSDNEILNPYLLDRVGCLPVEKTDCSYGASVGLGLFKNDIIKKVKFVSERKWISEDMIFDLEFIPLCKKIVHTNKKLYYYRFNPNSLTTRYVPDRFDKNVALCDEMGLRLDKIYHSDIYKIRLNRYFLKITRIALIEEIVHIRENGWKRMRANIKRIANNEKLVQILSVYPIELLPLPQRIFFSLLKRKMYLALIILLKGNMFIKRR